MGWEELKWRQLKYNQLMSSQGPNFSQAVQLKPTIKVQISGRMASIGINCCDHFNILGENPYEEVDDDENDNYYY